MFEVSERRAGIVTWSKPLGNGECSLEISFIFKKPQPIAVSTDCMQSMFSSAFGPGISIS